MTRPWRRRRGGFRWCGNFRHVDLLAAIRARRKFHRRFRSFCVVGTMSPPSRTTGCALKLNEIKYIRGRSFASVSTSFRGVPSEMVAASSGNSTLSRAYSNASECARVCLTNTNRRSVSDRKLRAWSFRRRRDMIRMPRSARAGFVFSRLEICCRSSADKCSQSRWNGKFTGARIRRLRSGWSGSYSRFQSSVFRCRPDIWPIASVAKTLFSSLKFQFGYVGAAGTGFLATSRHPGDVDIAGVQLRTESDRRCL